MTLRRKLGLALGAVLLLVAAQSVVTVVLLTQVLDRSALLVRPALTRVDLLAHAEADVLRHRTLEYSFLLTPDAGARERAREEMGRLQAEIDRRLAQYGDLDVDEARTDELVRVRQALAEYLRSYGLVVAAVRSGDQDEALWEYLRFQGHFQELDDRLHALRHREYDATAALRDRIVQDAALARWPILAVVVFVAGLEVGILAYFTRGFARSLGQLQDGAGRIAREQFDEPVPTPPERELGELAEALNRAMAGLSAGRREREQIEAARQQLAHVRVALVVRAQEEERARIARELHDQAAQAMTALHYGLAHVKRVATDPVLAEEIDRLTVLAARTGRQVAGLARDLRPSVLDDLGLVPALRGLVREFTDRFGVPVELSVHGSVPRLAPDAETTVFRVVQEALTNVAKHAAATRVWVDLAVGEGAALHLVVRDDGRGFDPARLGPAGRSREQSGLGLGGIHERVRLLEGELAIETAPGAGTRLRVRLPLDTAPAAEVVAA
jgi:signal transduction histidine kinase